MGLASRNVTPRNEHVKILEDARLLELRFGFWSCRRRGDGHGDRGVAQDAEEVDHTRANRDFSCAQAIKMLLAGKMIAVKIKRRAKITRELFVTQILRRANQAQMHMVNHLVPLGCTRGENGPTIECLGVEQQSVHIENDGLKGLWNH